MGGLSREQIVQYIRKLEQKVKQLQVVIRKRDQEIQSLRARVTALTDGQSASLSTAATQEAVTAPPTTETPLQAEAAMVERPKFKLPPKTKPLEEKPKTFTMKMDVGANQRLKEAMESKEDESLKPVTDLERPAKKPSFDPIDHDEADSSDTQPPVQSPEEYQPFVPSVNFNAGEFLEAVLDGEEEADEVKALIEKLGSVEPDQKRSVLIALTSVYWRMVVNMGKRLASENLAWEKRLCMRYGMLDESLMPERRDVWEQLYLDKSAPEDTGVYYADEWLEAVFRGELRYSTIDEMALDGRKPDPNAVGEVALKYELINLPQMQRMCVGARANQVAIMTQEYCNPSRDAPVLNRAWIQNALKEALKCDHIMFQRKYKGDEVEVQPLFVLLPGYGQRSGCWEPYSLGRKGNTGPRILYCLFPPRKPMQTFLMGIADYRWEYAKADAMHYWLSEGLTGKWIALFTRKEQRKDMKAVFIDSYYNWVTYEARRIPKLEKRFREFLYYNCPFSDEIKQQLRGGGMFARMIELEEKKKLREEEERQEIERIKAEREKRKAARHSKMA